MNARSTLVVAVLAVVLAGTSLAGGVAASDASAGANADVRATDWIDAGVQSADGTNIGVQAADWTNIGVQAADWTNTGVQAEECTYPVTVEDATGTEVEISQEPERVVTLVGDTAQTVWEIGAEDKVVGVTGAALYLDGAGDRADVGTEEFATYDVERMVELETDLVLAANVVPDQEVDRIRDAGITVVKFESASTVEDVREKTTLTGRLVGECEGAATTNQWMERNLAAVEDAVGDRDRPGAVYVFGTATVGDGTFIHDMIVAAGADNVMAEAGETGFVTQVDEEVVADRDPEWLILEASDTETPDREPFASTTAVEEGNVVRVDANYLNQPAPRSVVYAVRNLTGAFHGDAYGQEDYVTRSDVASGDETPTPTATPTATPGDDGTPTATPTDGDGDESPTPTRTSEGDGNLAEDGDPEPVDDGDSEGLPGFGVGVALVAVLASLAVLARR